MKKSLVALAALAATSAFAQSSVSITGLMDAGYQSLNIRGNKVTDVGANGSGTTAVIFAGTEDLGGGMKAMFQYEIDPNITQTSSKTAGTSATGTTSNVTSSAGNGQSFIGLSGAMGMVRLGAPNLATLSVNGDGNSGFGTAVGSGYRVSSFDAVRFQSALRLDTAVYSGFSASYYFVPKNDKQSGGSSTGNAQNQINGRDGATEIGLAYAQGPLTARYASLKLTQDAGYYNNSATVVTRPTGAAFKVDSISVKYTVTPTLSAALFNQKVSSDATLMTGSTTAAAYATTFDRKTTGISAAYDATPVLKLMVHSATTKNGAAVGTAAGIANKTTKVTGLGADYSMSKRTTAYVRYEKNDDQADIRSTAGYTDVTGNAAKYTATAVGIRHTF